MKIAKACIQHRVATLLATIMVVIFGVMYGSPETTPGGLALKYYASVRIDVRRI